MIYRLSALFCVLSLSVLTAFGQTPVDNSWREYDPDRVALINTVDTIVDTLLVSYYGPFNAEGTGKVKINQDVFIDSLQSEYNRSQKRPGYRIQIYRGNNSDEARNVKLKFLYRRDDQRAYMQHDGVYFTVRVGDFRTDLDAMKYLNEIREYYPTAYILRDMIGPIQLTEEVAPEPEKTEAPKPETGNR